jgi:hypothetical protein
MSGANPRAQMLNPPMFNPRPRIERLAIGPRHDCLVIDDALLEPERWVEYAATHRGDFAELERNAYPGPELQLPEAATMQLEAFFALHLRRLLGGRRTLRRMGRLSLATAAPEALGPRQCFCHVDHLDLPPGHMIAASVLYLFRDPALGGTGFYMPKKPPGDIAGLVRAAAEWPAEKFHAETGIARGYMTDSNAWFHKVLAVEPRWNRMIVYPGTVLHSADIAAPRLLSEDPRYGRLTINGFFACTRALPA